nr:immunoglobulin heavy chain junction region [Mus musculus]
CASYDGYSSYALDYW